MTGGPSTPEDRSLPHPRHVQPRRTATTALLMLLAALAVPAARAACPMPLPSLAVSVAGHHLDAELAATEAARQCGLSRRASLAAERGMLFVFDAPVRVAFWMKDTTLPLSIAFIDQDGRILALADMAPLDSRHHHSPGRPYRYALETNLGWFARHGIRVGDHVRFTLPAP